MKKFNYLVKRNTKLFFKDKGLFFCSLITPLILLILYITFLGRLFKDSISQFITSVPGGVNISNGVINSIVGGQLLASLLAVSCITVAFSSNMLMVQDKINGAKKDFLITPLKKSTLAMSYYFSTLICTFIICSFATIVCFIYLGFIGFYLSFLDCLLIFIDIFILTMFGTVLSSIINHFLTSQGQVSAVGTIVSSMYGFICGAYMPLTSFSSGLQKALSFLPGTYATSLLKRHTLKGSFLALANEGLPQNVINAIKDSVDYNYYFFDKKVSTLSIYLILISTIAILLGIYILINYVSFKKRSLNTKIKN